MVSFSLEKSLTPQEWHKQKQTDEHRNWRHILVSRYLSKEADKIYNFCNENFREDEILIGVNIYGPEHHFAIAFKNDEDYNLFKLCIPQKIK